MKRNLRYLFAVVWLLGCEKEKEINNDTFLDNARPNCIGNYWETSSPFYGHADNSTLNIPFTLTYNNKLYLFDATSDVVRIYNGSSWTSLLSSVPFASFDPPNFGFTIGTKAYVGNIDINSLTHPFWEYDFAQNSWAQKANFPGTRRDRASASAFTIGNKGYVTGGLSESNSNAITLGDTWEYDPTDDSWEQKANVPAAKRAAYGSGFSVNNKGYVVAGQYITEPSSSNLKTLMEYDPVADTWTAKLNFPGVARYHPSVFVIGGYAYVGCGRGGINTFFKDFYRYSAGGNSWTSIADVTTLKPSIFGFSLNSKGYVEFIDQSSNPNFLLRYTPKSCIVPTTPTKQY